MKKAALVLAALGMAVSAHASEAPQFLGDFNLRVSEAVFYPSENQVNFGQPSKDTAYGNFHYRAEEAIKLWVRWGGGVTSGCSSSDIGVKYTWIELDSAGKEVGRAVVRELENFALKESTDYVLRADYSNLKKCQFAAISFLAVKAK